MELGLSGEEAGECCTNVGGINPHFGCKNSSWWPYRDQARVPHSGHSVLS